MTNPSPDTRLQGWALRDRILAEQGIGAPPATAKKAARRSKPPAPEE